MAKSTTQKYSLQEELSKAHGLNRKIPKSSFHTTQQKMANDLLGAILLQGKGFPTLSENEKIEDTINTSPLLLNVLKEATNINIRHNPIAVVEKALIGLNALQVLDKNQRESIIDEYISLFTLEEDDKTFKENANRYRPHLKKPGSKDEFEFKERYINPIVELMPPEVTWARELEEKLIHKLINEPLGINLNND